MTDATQDEFERSFLVRSMPASVSESASIEIHDIYIPFNSQHCKLRLRKSGEVLEMTKKIQAVSGNSSHLIEYNIPLTQPEFDELKKVNGKEVRKTRYYYSEKGVDYQIGVFHDKLQGLVVVDVEFTDKNSMECFKLPAWLLVEVTEESFLAGGELCGKSYDDLSPHLNKLGYVAIF